MTDIFETYAKLLEIEMKEYQFLFVTDKDHRFILSNPDYEPLIMAIHECDRNNIDIYNNVLDDFLIYTKLKYPNLMEKFKRKNLCLCLYNWVGCIDQ